MEYIKILLSSLLSLAALFATTKIIGNKQMSQLNMFDYINGITIGSIAADMSIHLDNNILYPLIAIFVYTAVIALIAYIGSKNIAVRRFFTGKSIVLMDKGTLFYRNFKTAKIDFNEFLTQCRISGYHNLDDIETAILEQNGKISFLPRAISRPATPKDLNLTPDIERPFFCIISDGKLLERNMEESGLSHKKLEAELRCRNLEVSEVYAALYDGNKICIYPKTTDGPKNDIGQ